MAIQAMSTACTGLSALSQDIDVTANNLANVNTVGFKGSRANFEDLLYQHQEIPGTLNSQNVTKPMGLSVGLGTRISGTQVLFSQGPAITTGRPLDIQIDGEGFFQVNTGSDVGGGVGYTRAGNLFTNRDGELVLGNSSGLRLAPPISVPIDATSIDIGKDGKVSVLLPGSTTPQEVGQIQLARFVNPAGLEQVGGNIFLATAASGDATVGNPGEDGLGPISSGFLEGSNVEAVKELVSLIKTQRAFELNSQVITTSNEMLQTITRLKQ